MPNNHIVTRNIGNLRGFSTDSIFLRPSNVADVALNLQRAPDGTTQLRRGYQCQIGEIGGMGIGTFDDPSTGDIQTVAVGMDGFVYNKLTKQIYLYYDGKVTGNITGATNSNPCIIASANHGLQNGTQVIIRDVGGMVNLNNNTYTVSGASTNFFSLLGVNSSPFPLYTSGGYWSIAFADQRYLTFSIFTDPRYLNAPTSQSITCNIIVNRAAQVNGTQTSTNTLTVQFGHELSATDVIQFVSSNGILNQRNVVSTTPTSVTFDGSPVTVNNLTYINQFFDILFGKGFDVSAPYLISTFISTITDPSNGIYGLQVAINGLSSYPAAFLQIVEPTIIDSNNQFTMDYWYWNQVNSTITPPLPGSANITFQNSPNFENASLAVYDDVIYIANGWDYPQKYDGQTVYRTGMPIGERPTVVDFPTSRSKPFTAGEKYQYATTYEQVDARGHIVEGEISEIFKYDVVEATGGSNYTVVNLTSTIGNNWNTNGARAGVQTASVYGPDIDGFYYDRVTVTSGFTLKIGDSAYYRDVACAVINGAQTDVFIINVNAGHGIVPGDTALFYQTSSDRANRVVVNTTDTTIQIEGDPVSVDPGLGTAYSYITTHKVSKVFGNVAIVDGDQTETNSITVLSGHTILSGNTVNFVDSDNNIQRRTVVSQGATSMTIDGIPVSVNSGILIASEEQRTGSINLQRDNLGPIIFTATASISNNLRINIYRTKQGEEFGVNGELYLVDSVANNYLGGSTTRADGISDAELGRQFDDPDQPPNPPPISKYLRAFGNQLFYAGGERGNPENSDRVFFSGVSGLSPNPEVVPLATNAFNVPNVDDDITGIGVSGSTLVTTKNQSIWAATGNFLSGQIDVVQIAPGTNIGCVSHFTIACVGSLMYFLHTNGVYAITENQLFPTDAFGNPIPISLAVNAIFRETKFLPQTRYVLKRAVAVNYTKDNQYLLFIPCEDTQSTIRTANSNSIILAYDYEDKNWYMWDNMNAAGGMFVIDDELYFQERKFSGVDGNTANLYKQHRFYRLVDHADHAGPMKCEWRSSWEDLGQPEVRKKFCRCVLLMDRVSELLQSNNPVMMFSSYLNRIPNLQNTIATITPVDNIRNSSWSYSGWGWNYWSGYRDSFITVNLKQGTVTKSIQVGFTIQGINMDIKLAGFQLEAIPENRKSVLR